MDLISGVISYPSKATTSFSLSLKQNFFKMEEIFSNPGFHHIAEKICWDLDIRSLQNLSKASDSTKSNCENVFAWLRRNLKIRFNHSQILIFAREKRKLRKLAILGKTNMKQILLKDSASRFGLKMEPSNPLDCLVILDQTHLVKIFNSPTQNHLDYAIQLGSIQMARVVFEQIRENVSVQNKNFTRNIIRTAINCDDESLGLEIVKVLAPLIENPIAPKVEKGFVPTNESSTLIAAVIYKQFEIAKVLLPLCNYHRDQKHVKTALKKAESQMKEAESQMKNADSKRENSFLELIEIIDLFKKWLAANGDFQFESQKKIPNTIQRSDKCDNLSWWQRMIKEFLSWMFPFLNEPANQSTNSAPMCKECSLKYENAQIVKQIS